jgi:hypothetical protein
MSASGPSDQTDQWEREVLVGICDFPSAYEFPPQGYGGIERWLWAGTCADAALCTDTGASPPSDRPRATIKRLRRWPRPSRPQEISRPPGFLTSFVNVSRVEPIKTVDDHAAILDSWTGVLSRLGLHGRHLELFGNLRVWRRGPVEGITLRYRHAGLELGDIVLAHVVDSDVLDAVRTTILLIGPGSHRPPADQETPYDASFA